MFQSPGEIAFSILNFPIYYYGIIMSFAIFVGFACVYYLYKKYYGNPDKILDFSPYLIILGIVGARLYYCLVNYSYYVKNPLDIFNIREGGLSVHGMIIFGIIALWRISKTYKISFLNLTDVFLCGTILAQSIGRWGNFFNSEAFGAPCNYSWGLFIPPSHRPVEYINFEYFHPTFLYESLLDFLIFIIIFSLFKKLHKKSGMVTALYLIMYSSVRIAVESLRVDSVLNLFGVPVAQIVSFLLLVCGIILVFNLKKLYN